MTRVAYFDLANGISGDMTLAAITHAGRKLGVPVETAITDAITELGLGCSVAFTEDERGGIACLHADVKTNDEHLSPDELHAAIARANVPKALAALEALVAAEQAVHGTDDVHLHELGSPDTAVDLAGSAAALEALGVTDVVSAPVPLSIGWITAGHGDLPLPAPVTLEILRGAAIKGVDTAHELVTPTGAAILVGHRAVFGPPPKMTLEATGVGSGTKRTEKPNITRVLIGESIATAPSTDACVLLETNIDDQTPQSLARATELLLEQGALDAWITPIVMKKGRPAFLLSALVRPTDETRLCDSILRNTTTIGVRRRVTDRYVAEREIVRVEVGGEQVDVKIARVGGEIRNIAPEYEDCVSAASRTQRTFDDVRREAIARAQHALDES